MSNIVLYIAIGIAVWVASGILNYAWYNRFFGADGGINPQRDLLVLLGPIGTFMMLLMNGIQIYLTCCNSLGKRFSGANSVVLMLVVVLVPWLGAGVANHIWYGRIFDDVSDQNMQRDLLVMWGPIGSFMLLLCAGVQGFVNLCSLGGAASR